MKKPLIPFDWLPASWGLKGKTREIAQAEYELSGIELEYRLAEIHHDSDEKALKKAKLDIQKKYQKISQEDYEKAVIELQIHNEQDKKLALLELELEGAKQSLNSFFSMKIRAEEEGTKVLDEAIITYLRRAENGGMPDEEVDLVRSVVNDAARIYLWYALVPIIRGIASSAQKDSNP
jgi:hypothetical protein